jgi:hypothetical protein
MMTSKEARKYMPDMSHRVVLGKWLTPALAAISCLMPKQQAEQL